MRSREGDYIEDFNRVIFDVKGLVHPPERAIAFPRFVPNSSGNRKRGDSTYRKFYALSERYKLLKDRFPQYLVYDPVFGEHICEVPKKDIQYHYNPVDCLGELRYENMLDALEADALRFVEFLQDHAKVRWDMMGISGSLLAKLHTQKSDIDLIVYGKDNCLKVYDALRAVGQNEKSTTIVYTKEELETLYNFRSQDTRIPFDDFIIAELRKVLQGKFMKRDFYIRCIKDWNEVEEQYGDMIYRKAGYAKLKATISDDSEAIFTPCRYSIDEVQVLEGKCEDTAIEIASFRGRFCEQARKGERVIAQGKVEEVQQKKTGETHFRLLLGGNPSDFLILER